MKEQVTTGLISDLRSRRGEGVPDEDEEEDDDDDDAVVVFER
jgi:hypothetical protein